MYGNEVWKSDKEGLVATQGVGNELRANGIWDNAERLCMK